MKLLQPTKWLLSKGLPSKMVIIPSSQWMEALLAIWIHMQEVMVTPADQVLKYPHRLCLQEKSCCRISRIRWRFLMLIRRLFMLNYPAWKADWCMVSQHLLLTYKACSDLPQFWIHKANDCTLNRWSCAEHREYVQLESAIAKRFAQFEVGTALGVACHLMYLVKLACHCQRILKGLSGDWVLGLLQGTAERSVPVIQDLKQNIKSRTEEQVWCLKSLSPSHIKSICCVSFQSFAHNAHAKACHYLGQVKALKRQHAICRQACNCWWQQKRSS